MKLTKTAGSLIAATSLLGGVGLASTTSTPAHAAVTHACNFAAAQPTLSSGSHGITVVQLQCELDTSMHNTSLDFDGSFGPATLAAVKKFQRCTHISVDGVVGPNTWSLLNYYSNSTGWAC